MWVGFLDLIGEYEIRGESSPLLGDMVTKPRS